MQAYFIFSIGNVRQIITAQYPNCWKTYVECQKTLTQAPDYTQIIGAPSCRPLDVTIGK